MTDTLIIQSHRSPLPYPWLTHCIESVRAWCEVNRYQHQFIGDELFECLPETILQKTTAQPVIATDLARLLVIKAVLKDYSRVIWLDADFLIFNPVAFVLSDTPYAVGREVWVQHDFNGKLKLYKKVHNAFLMFHQHNHFLDFYAETAQRLLMRNEGTVPPQFIGPKLLTALHNVANLHVMESAGMLSPLVIKDIVQGGGDALSRFVTASPQTIAGANLCGSSCERDELSDDEMMLAINVLLENSLESLK